MSLTHVPTSISPRKWIAATKLQAIMRGRAERKKHAKRKGAKKKKKKG